MYLRKTTTSPGRGLDVLYPLYQLLPDSHQLTRPLSVLQIGAGVVSNVLAERANRSKMMRRMDSLVRSLPLPEKFFSSFEPFELYEAFKGLGYIPKMRVADINPNVLSIVKNKIDEEQMAFELIDVTEIPYSFLQPSFDVCVILNVLPHVKCPKMKQKSVNNLIQLTNDNGYIVGVFDEDIEPVMHGDGYEVIKIDRLIYQKKVFDKH